MFYNCKTFNQTIVPFVTQQYGLTCFLAPFPHSFVKGQSDIYVVLKECFPHAPSWMKLAKGKVKLSIGAYQPNIMARRFGMSQILPKKQFPGGLRSFYSHKRRTIEDLAKCHNFFKYEPFYLSSFKYSFYFYCPKLFDN